MKNNSIFIVCMLSCIYTYVLCSILKGRALNNTRPDYELIGRASGEMRHQIIISIKQNNLRMIDNLLYDVSTVESPNYGKHKSFDEIGLLVENRVGTEAVVQWLMQHEDVQITKQTKYGEYITCNAKASTWESMFEMTLYQYQHKTTSKHVLRANYYYIPEFLFDSIEHVVYLLNLPPRMSSSSPSSPQAIEPSNLDPGLIEKSPLSAFPSAYVVPSTLYNMYHITGNGSYSTSQAVYEAIGQTFLPSDVTLFQTSFSIPQDAVDIYIGDIPSNSVCTSDTNSCAEASLDVEYMLAVSPYSPMTYYYDDTGDGSFVYWITDISSMSNPSNVYSVSYSAYEVDIGLSDLKTFNTEAMKLGARGVTLVAASGDDGITGFKFYSTTGTPISQCGYYAQWPSSSMYVVSVGGTMNGQYITGTSEIVCSSATGSGITSGGGFSNQLASPSFQRKAINSYIKQYTAGQSSYQPYNTSNRGYPDVSMAANRYITYIGGKAYSLSGTSASTPVFAGLVVLANSYRLRHGKSLLGWINPSIYSNDGGFTNDILQGNNNCTKSSTRCCAFGFSAKTGWDPTTGFGSVDYTSFLNYFASVANLPTSMPTAPPTPAEGSPTHKPTKSPTPSPSQSPSAMPSSTASPTKSPSHKPTKSPATSCPTSKPTFLPPTSTPSYAPSYAPSSFAPTHKPTKEPVPAPTLPPLSPSSSQYPSTQPSQEPTHRPSSYAPSEVPTAEPTSAPTYPEDNIQKTHYNVEFNILQTFASQVSASQLISDPSAIQSLYDIFLTIFAAQDIYTNRIYSASDGTGTYSASTFELDAATNVQVNYTIMFIVYPSAQTNINTMVNYLQSNVTQQLTTSITTNQFTALLAASSSPSLTGMVANVVPVVPMGSVAYDQASSSGNDGLSTATIAGAVVGAILGLIVIVLLIVLCVYYCAIPKKSTSNPTTSTDTMQMTSNPISRANQASSPTSSTSPKKVELKPAGETSPKKPVQLGKKSPKFADPSALKAVV